MKSAARPIFLIAALSLHAALVAIGIAFFSNRPPKPPASLPVHVSLIPPSVEAPGPQAAPAPARETAPASPPATPPETRRPRPLPRSQKRKNLEPHAAAPARTVQEKPPVAQTERQNQPVMPAAPAQTTNPAPASSPQSAAATAAAPSLAPSVRTGVSLPAGYAANNRKPEYPPASRRLEEQGTVVLRVLVQPDGSAGAVEVKSSSGYPRLDQSAMSAVRTWRFHPATVDGKPVAEWYQIPIPFTLEN